MAAVASKAPYTSNVGLGSSQPSVISQYAASYRKPVGSGDPHPAGGHGQFLSPTESEFSIHDGDGEVIKAWDEKKVCDWLRAINCSQYEQLFKVNNVTGSNLIECDQLVLKEMGIKKIGDRVRIFVAIKALRTKAVGNSRKRNRDSLAALDSRQNLTPYTPSSASSPRHLNTPRDRQDQGSGSNRRWSRQIDSSMLQDYYPMNSSARPGSPMNEHDGMRSLRTQRPAGMSPLAPAQEGKNGYFGAPATSARNATGTGVRPATPNSGLPRPNANTDSTVGKLPVGQAVIRVIYNGGQTKVLNIKNCRALDDIILNVLKKLNLPENQSRNYCFWNLDGNGQDLANTHKLSDTELLRFCTEPYDRNERGRLILRKRHAGEPDEEELRKAAAIMLEEQHEKRQEALKQNNPRSRSKIEQQTGVSWQEISDPLSPATYGGGRFPPRDRSGSSASSYGYGNPPQRSDSMQKPKIKEFMGGRPPSELISQELTTYFPGHDKTHIERTPLAEESPVEPNRKSYVSFESDSQVGGNNGNESDTSHTALSSYFDESGSSGPTTEAGGSLTENLSTAIAADGEEPDEELNQFLKGDSWDNVRWMQGALIGQGSFGSVFLALHAVTGELMAVKQVEMPSKTNSVLDKKKENMLAALKREIDLLRDLQHENIVQYLGSNSDDEHFNIFLEYVPGGSVAAMLNSYGSLQEPLIRNFVRQILTGLSYLHGRDIIHRDIKGANVLVDNKGNIKISDFGISKRVEASALLQPQKNGGHLHRPSLQGSVFWMAPEVVRQTSYTRKADIWSLGCLIVEMFTGTHPFPNCSQLQAIFQIGNSSAKPNIPDGASSEGKDFLNNTFEIDHEKRPSADELLLSPFLKQIA
ncbi:uncharacterized protein KY384_003816 [Bacidia gigantensis]|uniref:uncharacterized protein n=1 Tax=Bacidia gigantensis TaxID=2732470 RepID=UPI001D0425D8|nr:uncharacterized protein KY384_003816 [Bacidia gigantensis]KAG8532176.1 hypothetical protein KY384_003816 [Bacidia gigantensis]